MQTIQMTRDEIEARTGRFDKLQPMEFMKNDTTPSCRRGRGRACMRT